ncbi:MAG: family 16 glycosylhydrolase [Treponema sp.]|nr:family 16 glycosylhydrolase [Treponema sp.]
MGNKCEEKIIFNGKTYVQTFFDDFDGDKLDDSKWSKCPEWQRQDYGGYWKDDCSYLKDSMLVVEARKDGDMLYSGAIRTKEKFYQGYGLYKFRFKAEKTTGCWYALWLMSETEEVIGGGAVGGAEIDIIEIISNDPAYSEDEKKYLNSAVHWDGYGKDHKTKASRHLIDDAFYDTWHEVTFEWTPEYYKAWLDDCATPFWDTTGMAEEYGGINTQPNYMKITAEFGKWGGKIDESVLPCHLYVDWVKVWKAE